MIQATWKSYFLFSKKELKGIIVLGIILFASILIGQYFPAKSTSTTLGSNNTTINRLFNFDPNTIDSLHALELGIPERQVKSLIHYRQKGGYFKNPDDFAKLYGLTPNLFVRLRPYIVMPSNLYRNSLDGKKWRPKFELNSGNKFSNKDGTKWTIDINKAEAAEWMRKTNLSSPIVQRILAYKSYLGSFSSVHQIQKVYGMNDSLYQSLRGHLSIQQSPLNLLNANAMQFNDWKALSLFSDQQIWNILKMKKEDGGRISWKKLVVLCDMGEGEALALKSKLNISD
jgi:DNA uptake protein ComE-like DNA-binding protein